MEKQPLMALTVRQPWAWFILHGGKDVENRSWRTDQRGTIALHAAAGFTGEEQDRYLEIAEALRGDGRITGFPPPTELPRGAIVGLVDILDCVEDHESEWFGGPYGFVLARPRALERPLPCRGALNFWRVPEEHLDELRALYRAGAARM